MRAHTLMRRGADLRARRLGADRLDGREPDWRRCELRVTKRTAPMILERMRKYLDDEAYA